MGRCRMAGQRCCQGLAVKCLSRHEIWYALCSHSDFIHRLNFILGGWIVSLILCQAMYFCVWIDAVFHTPQHLDKTTTHHV